MSRLRAQRGQAAAEYMGILFIVDEVRYLRFDNRHASRTGGRFTYDQVSDVVEHLLNSP